jgi:hypothetical protein
MQEEGETDMSFPQSVYLIDLRQITHITIYAGIWNNYNTYSHRTETSCPCVRNVLLVVALFNYICLLAQLERRKLLCPDWSQVPFPVIYAAK